MKNGNKGGMMYPPVKTKPQGQGASSSSMKAETRPNLKTTFGVPKKQK